MSHVTIYDVAAAAGVAPSTVSRALSRPGRVRAETAAHIREVATRLGYRNERVSGPASDHQTKVLAIMTSDIANPMMVDIVRGVQEEARALDMLVSVFDSGESEPRERHSLDHLLPLVDGIILTSSRMQDASIRHVAKQKPLVLLNRHVPDVATLIPDNTLGIQQACEHLVGLGHHDITYLGGPEASWSNGVRWTAMKQAKDALSVRLRRTGPDEPSVRGGIRAAAQWLQRPTSAVIAFNDLMALGFMQAMRGYGLSVPGDVSLIGYDNILVAQLTVPQLTTVATPRRRQGVLAVNAITAQLRGRGITAEAQQLLPTKLIVRESTAAPGKPVPARG